MKISWQTSKPLNEQVISVECACFGYVYLDGQLLSPSLTDENYNQRLTQRISQIRSVKKLQSTVSALEGFFSGWLLIDSTVYCFSDYLGLCPLYVYANGIQIVISEDSDNITKDKSLQLTLDVAQLASFSKIGHFEFAGTAFNEIAQIWGGHIYSFSSKDGWTSQAYIELGDFISNKTPLSRYHYAEEANKHLKALIARYLKNEKQYVLPLSGGLDSRQLGWFAHQHTSTKGAAMTFGEAGSPDMVIAKKVAHSFKIEQRPYELTYDNWLDHVNSAILRTRGQVSVSSLVPPASLIAEYKPVGPLLSGVGGNITVGGSSVWMQPPNLNQVSTTTQLSSPLHIFSFPKVYLNLILKWPEFYRLVINLRRQHFPTFRDIGYGQYRLPLLERDLLTLLYRNPPKSRQYRQLQIDMAITTFSKDVLEIPMNSTMLPLKKRGSFLTRIKESASYRLGKLTGTLPREELYDHDRLWRLHGEEMKKVILESGLLNILTLKNSPLGTSFKIDCALYTLAFAYAKWLPESSK